MRLKKNQFVPAAPDGLEARVALSRGAALPPAILQDLKSPGTTIRRGRVNTTATLVNDSFAAFSRDYAQVRGLYLAALTSLNPSTADRAAFEGYTTQRVNVLAQELVSSMLPGLPRQNGSQRSLTAVQAIVARRINGRTAAGNFKLGTLAQSLLASIPAAGSSAATTSMFALAQDNAIEAARVGILNGISVYKVSASANNR